MDSTFFLVWKASHVRTLLWGWGSYWSLLYSWDLGLCLSDDLSLCKIIHWGWSSAWILAQVGRGVTWLLSAFVVVPSSYFWIHHGLWIERLVLVSFFMIDGVLGVVF